MLSVSSAVVALLLVDFSFLLLFSSAAVPLYFVYLFIFVMVIVLVLMWPLFLVDVPIEVDISRVLSVFKPLLLCEVCDLAVLAVFSHIILVFLSSNGTAVVVGVADSVCV